MKKRIKLYFQKNSKKAILFISFIFLMSTLLLTMALARNITISMMNQIKQNLGSSIQLMFDQSGGSGNQNNNKTPQISESVLETLKNDQRVKSTEFLRNRQIIVDQMFPVEGGVDVTNFSTKGHNFWLFGINSPYLREDKAFFKTLVEGRTFSQDEIDNGENVALLTYEIAKKNGINIGDVLTFRYEITGHDPKKAVNVEYIRKNPEILATYTFEVKIIGIYEPKISVVDMTLPPEAKELISASNNSLQNIIYTPTSLLNAVDTFDKTERNRLELPMVRLEGTDIPRFILHSPDDVLEFIQDYQDKIPSGYKFLSAMNDYKQVTTTLEKLLKISNRFISITVIIYVFVLIALCWNYVRDRQKESAVLLAMGETKRKIILQLTTELALLATFGITVAFGLAMIIGTQLGGSFIAQQYTSELKQLQGSVVYQVFAEYHLAPADIVEMAQNSLSLSDVFVLFILIVITILIVTVMNTIYMNHLSPRKILIE